MITEQYIEELNLPDYEDWVEGIWCDDYWWDWLIEDRLEEWRKLGVTIDSGGAGKRMTPHFYFDLYRNEIASRGRIIDNKQFYEAYKDTLLKESLVLTHMFLEDWIYVSWTDSSRSTYNSYDISFPSDYDVEGEEFKTGLLSGTSVSDLYEEETHNTESFEECLAGIIDDLHNELLKDMQKAYEYDTSEERYREWILEQIYDNLPTTTTS